MTSKILEHLRAWIQKPENRREGARVEDEDGSPVLKWVKELRDAEDLFTEEPSLTVDGRLPRRVAAAS